MEISQQKISAFGMMKSELKKRISKMIIAKLMNEM